MKIVTVLRSGGEYKPRHVERLAKQLRQHCDRPEIWCLTDTVVEGVNIDPLRYRWPGWWAKIEMFRDVREPFLYMDLDTTIVDPIDDLLKRKTLTVLSDFYRPKQIQSSLMLVTPEAAKIAWGAFMDAPQRHMEECNQMPTKWGDQGFLEGVWGRHIERWQDVLPRQVVGYKTDVRKATTPKEHGDGTVPNGARVIISHGLPRPWECGL